jgi:hypothetical protein
MALPSTVEQLRELLDRAVHDLIASGAMAEFTAATRQSEWNLTQHLATAIEGYLPELRKDVDLIKPAAGLRRPDIVFHVAKTHRANFLAIELKKDGSARAVLADVAKIRRYWFAAPYRYSFGAAINLRSDNTFEIRVLANPNRRRIPRRR